MAGGPPLETPGQDETLDRLAGEWWIYQLRHGHRYNTDDVLTAWTAARARPDACRLLDLGAGVGAVGLMTLLRMSPEARLTTIEVQPVSAGLQRRTLELNRLTDRVTMRRGDVRDRGLLDPAARFDLITANPPYFEVARATAPGHPQRAAARLELHGDVRDFCRVAAAHLDLEGRFCFCFPAGDPRAEAAIAASGLVLLSRQDIVFREGGPPIIALFTCGRTGERRDLSPLATRTSDGRRTDAYRQVRIEMWIEA